MTNLHTLISPLVSDMIAGGYFISDVDLAEFLSAITAFSNANLDPFQARNKRKLMNQNLNRLVTEAFSIMRNCLDPNSASFKSISLEYYNGYVINRHVQKPATISTKCRVNVINDVDEKPIFNAEISISNTTLKTKTNITGDAVLNKVRFGTHQVSVSINGFKSQTSPYTVFKKGRYVDIAFRLVPDNFTIPEPQPEIINMPVNA